MIIRNANSNDIEELFFIESQSYPKAEAASLDNIKLRIKYFKEDFYILEEDNIIKAYISGMKTSHKNLIDEMYYNCDLYDSKGKVLMLFSVVSNPKYRNMGYVKKLMNEIININNDLEIVLTCKRELITFYEQFGFINEGRSVSNHGSAVWYQMRKSHNSF